MLQSTKVNMSITTSVKFMCATKYTSPWHEKHNFSSPLKWSMASIGFIFIFFFSISIYLFSNSVVQMVLMLLIRTITCNKMKCFFYVRRIQKQTLTYSRTQILYSLFFSSNILNALNDHTGSSRMGYENVLNEQVNNMETMRSIGKVRELNQALRR